MFLYVQNYPEIIDQPENNEFDKGRIMQSVTLWIIYVVIFVLVFSAVALAIRGFLGIAWGVLIGAIVAMVITAGVSWCMLPGDYRNNCGITCLGFLAVVLLIIGIILVIVAYVMRNRHKKKLKKLECCDEKSIQDDLNCHPDGVGKEKTKKDGKYEEKHVNKTVTNCDPDGRCTTRYEKLDAMATKAHASQRTNRSLL